MGSTDNRRDDRGRARGPSGGDLRDQFERHVQVVAHHRVTPDGYTEDAGQFMDSILDPLPTVFGRSARQSILATQEGAANTARDAVKGSWGTLGDQDLAGVGHGDSIAARSLAVSRKSAR